MSTFSTTKIKCCKCNETVEVAVLTSTNIFGSPDLDLRPPEMQRSTMSIWIQECPHCGYINYLLDEDNGIDREFLKNKEFASCDSAKIQYVLACRFYKFYKILLELKQIESAYSALLRTAWCYDDAKDEKNAKLCRIKMIELFDDFPEKEKNEAVLAVHADVMRRAGMFEEVIKKYQNFAAKDEVIKQVIKFQIALSIKCDDKCYTVADCMKNT